MKKLRFGSVKRKLMTTSAVALTSLAFSCGAPGSGSTLNQQTKIVSGKEIKVEDITGSARIRGPDFKLAAKAYVTVDEFGSIKFSSPQIPLNIEEADIARSRASAEVEVRLDVLEKRITIDVETNELAKQVSSKLESPFNGSERGSIAIHPSKDSRHLDIYAIPHDGHKYSKEIMVFRISFGGAVKRNVFNQLGEKVHDEGSLGELDITKHRGEML